MTSPVRAQVAGEVPGSPSPEEDGPVLVQTRAIDRGGGQRHAQRRNAALTGSWVRGAELISAWRARAGYPDTLVVAAVERSLGPEVLRGWGSREALADRGDDLAVHDLLSRAGNAVVGAVLALNRVYSPHRAIKWQSHLIGELDVTPERFAERLRLLWTSSNAQALREAEALLADTVQLVQARIDADISSFCDELSRRRRAIDPPSTPHRPATP